MSKKINLNEVTNLVKRGRGEYENPDLVADILALDASIDGDAFVFELATGDPSDDEFVNHKNTWRNRVAKCAEQADREVSIHWTTEGEMVVSLKPAKRKRTRK